MLDRPAAWGTALAIAGGAYLLRIVGVIGNWPLVIALFVALGAGQAIGARLKRQQAAPPGAEDVPVEWRGLVRPWLPSDKAELDAVLGLPRSELHGAARS
jgi:branched-chain amino acid transport system permease protein